MPQDGATYRIGMRTEVERPYEAIEALGGCSPVKHAEGIGSVDAAIHLARSRWLGHHNGGVVCQAIDQFTERVDRLFDDTSVERQRGLTG